MIYFALLAVTVGFVAFAALGCGIGQGRVAGSAVGSYGQTTCDGRKDTT